MPLELHCAGDRIDAIVTDDADIVEADQRDDHIAGDRARQFDGNAVKGPAALSGSGQEPAAGKSR